MEQGQKNRREAAVLRLLTSVEIDGFVVAQLRAIDGVGAILGNIAAGRAPASVYQRRNAVYVLGRLGETPQVPALLGLLGEGDRPLRLCAVVALAAIDLDTAAQEALRRFAESGDTEATEAAYAQEALSTIRRRARAAPSA